MRQPSSASLPIPVALPLLPPAETILPYLQQIDARRTYSNFGPQIRALETRLATHLGTAPGTVITVVNATLGLTLALQALGVRRGSLCVMPAWTFAASAHAAVAAGMRPFFVDVDPQSWALTPDEAMRAIAAAPGKVGAVMPVAPFGLPLDLKAWDRFHEQTRVPVVVDAAAGFDALVPGRVPAVVSLHATKILGAGEGGFVISSDKSLVVEIERRSNFGFMGGREARVAATNAKMNEYNAAVALAALDRWSLTRARFADVIQTYARHLRRLPGVSLMPGFGTDWVATTITAAFGPQHPLGDEIANMLADAGIATRRWWCRGLHEEEAFADFPHADLPVTTRLAQTTLGLPCYADMGRNDIARVCTALGQALRIAEDADMVAG